MSSQLSIIEAQLLGGDYADELLALVPGLSEDKCKLLDKKSADDFKQLATCGRRAYRRPQSPFWIADFEYSKDIQSFLNAASRLFGERNEELDANFANLCQFSINCPPVRMLKH